MVCIASGIEGERDDLAGLRVAPGEESRTKPGSGLNRLNRDERATKAELCASSLWSGREGGGVAARGHYGALAQGGLDRMSYGRAQDAFNAVMSTLAAMIDAIMKNPALTHDQKLAAVRELRQQKKAEAKAVRARIIQDEKDKMRAHRKKGGKGGKGPKPPSPKPH